MIDRRGYRAAVVGVGLRALRHPADRRALAAVLLGWPAVEAVVRAGRALDDLVAPAHREVPIRAPVFVVGHPRSGTTFLHRLLALDRRFYAPTAADLALPSVVLRRVVGEARGRRPLDALARRLERRLFAPLAHHDVRWTAPEEDDWLFLHAAATPTLEVLSGDPEATRRWWFGDRLPAEELDRALDWYRSCLRRLLHDAPAGATLLSKNPHFCGWMRALAAAFPDARFVMVVRDPSEAIASRLAMVQRAWSRGDERPEGRDPRYLRLFETSCEVYREAEAGFAALPAERRLRVAYAGLVTDPAATVARIREHFGWPSDEALVARVRAEADRARRRVPGARPMLRHFGVHPRRVREELGHLDGLWGALTSIPGSRVVDGPATRERRLGSREGW